MTRYRIAALVGIALAVAFAVALVLPQYTRPDLVRTYGGQAFPFDSLHRWHYADVARCVGLNPVPPRDLVLWQLPDSVYLTHLGRAYFDHQPPTIVVTAILDPSLYWPLMRHEFVHILTRSPDHAPPAFRQFARCTFLKE